MSALEELNIGIVRYFQLVVTFAEKRRLKGDVEAGRSPRYQLLRPVKYGDLYYPCYKLFKVHLNENLISFEIYFLLFLGDH